MANGGMDTVPQKGNPLDEQEGMKLKLDLNLDIEVELKAHIHGDLTLSLLYVVPFFLFPPPLPPLLLPGFIFPRECSHGIGLVMNRS
ncbi:hypothetical protein ASPZODRAFT_131316 [Penicilliopsis zonata CBS 506.65]|uniref:Uncharacterized protein n=1 Tax=Penicilliopsis zonata CBS 506.65 TaxID=1073090 RepID=A0A1L9SKW3_9EURO|nr:hypothetical protein ASPZODRAFT_131316 [Penicilliopsis zonata CBS 506.65]OJJ47751.1 hypothetical protein ASPZODRAFT_131316 [Penicilliopsis zonata CBS 506.65]